MKKTLQLIFCLFNVCFLNSQEPNLLGSLPYCEVSADVETAPVFAGDDAADDICILENKSIPDQSLIISSDKKYGIIVYNLKGKQIYENPLKGSLLELSWDLGWIKGKEEKENEQNH